MFDRSVVESALVAEVMALEGVLLGLSEAEVVLPTRCVPWDVAALSVHTAGSLNQVLVALDQGRPGVSEGLVSAAGYYVPEVRFSPEVNAARVEGAVERAARREDAAEPGRVLGGIWDALAGRLPGEPADRRIVTRHGDPMLLTDYLVTRVVELALHGLDLADALGREPWTSGAALDVLRGVLFGSVDPEELRRVLPEGVGPRGPSLAAVRAVTGRSDSEVDRAALAAAGVRLLALG
ncbi:maleylpyruvate isomerase N-terminal domain-containing protein [Nocardiopsis sp. L17-MgMaSL7]|uniref:maleylpyruvate isomerase N-terminal domain-containing protein n=1 Tax=Nocardiopsis sp. L17-MgMaSL7 TaxID=1938893 RepID=UPI000D718B86|nr:maleylpyruvate isomerase N-terminal domain-containing protein [Nocardiopsis sp. L17-MgMaSL7]PWV54615.1 mycothiol maleylpyruvate isomerase-like protein [Nocardiopsis sp. L17-MgMaSL7]